ncbi:LPXTG cell wall anchor domain-containing protein [Actinokineospora sp. UTMC 2448]|uniref:LPXTG cell wall anchor domain-containing protein n=1 Tax=Actinokineospora sp. UTMC 2448 TaxID=2268449 RepID=UPI002164980F|nr:LPXTG cell wall anchor domain-containing protein [Actinokineospora sp. UTMC 2448]UVS77213.1 hypothetical protein Actkin_00915 [Actinokineospora sp. UTMC 2448]
MLTTVTRAVLAAVAGLTLAAASASVASAQENPEDVPPTLVRVLADCAADGKTDVEVYLDDLGPYKVLLEGFGEEAQETALHEEHEVYWHEFTDVPVGDYVVRVEGADLPSDGVPVQVKACDDRKPSQPGLTVDVQCQGGWGVATFEVANTEGQTRSYTLEITEEAQQYEAKEILPGLFVRITENLYDDGTYTAVLSGESLDEPITEEFTVKCAPKDAPNVVADARCDDKEDVTTPAVVRVTVGNPNRHDADYTITVGDVTETVTVVGGWQETVDLGPFPGGVYPMTVIGSDGSETPTHVLVDYCEDVVVDDDGLQVSVRCVGEESVVTVRFFPSQSKRVFKVEGRPEFDAVVAPDRDGRYDWMRHEGIEDGVYTAVLRGPGSETREQFTVDCVEGGPTTTTTTTPPTSVTSGPPTTTPSGPPPQGSPGPVDDLPVTGAAVTGMVVLGLAALGMGAGLVFAARRRRV